VAPVPAAGGSLGSTQRGPGPAPAPYLESESPTPEPLVKVTGRVMCKRLGCGTVWCSCGCGMAKGLRLRDCLRAELESFRSPYFVTLTINRELFPGGPEDAFTWVRDHGSISEFVRDLRRAGHLLDNRYVAVLEFQEDEWPHWHLIFDAEFVPFDVICDAWTRAGWAGRPGKLRWGDRPKYEGKGQKPAFGGVRFRVKGRESLGAVCHYLTKYVTKFPDGGWPQWVLRLRSVRRWSTSRDFWRTSSPPRDPQKVTEWSKLRNKYFDPSEEWEEDEEFLVKIGKSKKTIGERLAGCGSGSVVLEEVELPPGEDGQPQTRWRFMGMVKADVWRDPSLGDRSTFKKLEECSPTHFVLSDPHGVSILRILLGLVEPWDA
jgi:hypothetical protein